MLMLVGKWEDACRGVRVRGPEDLGPGLCGSFGQLAQEALFVLPLGGDRRALACRLVALGTGNVACATPRDVFRHAITLSADSVVLTHNHPSGHPAPSAADLAFTKRIVDAGELLGVRVLDHLIVAGRSWRSLRESTSLWPPVP